MEQSPNVTLLDAHVPPWPEAAHYLDMIVVRGFQYYRWDETNGKETCRAIDSALRMGGYLVLHLNASERYNERKNDGWYANIVGGFLPHFDAVYDKSDALVYRKL